MGYKRILKIVLLLLIILIPIQYIDRELWRPSHNQIDASRDYNDSDIIEPTVKITAQVDDAKTLNAITKSETTEKPDPPAAAKIKSTSETIVVSGRVVSEYGELIVGENITFHSPQLKLHYPAVSSAYGDYIITDLRPGVDYVITVSPVGMFKRYSKTFVALEQDQEVYDIILESIPLGVLNGTVADAYNRPVSDMPLKFRTIEKDFWSTDTMTDINGNFVVPQFPEGRYEVSSAESTYRATGLSFDPVNGEVVNLIIDSGPYSLGGWIFDESGHAFDGANVVVVWRANYGDVRSHSSRQVNADASGKFRFTNLGPGDHELIISAWNDNSFKNTIKKIVNLGVDSGEIDILIETTGEHKSLFDQLDYLNN